MPRVKASSSGGLPFFKHSSFDLAPSNACQAVTFKPKNYCEILLSGHARTLQADILHLGQKAAKCMTCKWLCGKF